ncbi:hypothetical protein [Candidatus Magnetominusculus xianensis]|uniref:Uncharacterized protein n=1 Tax=Candidatus Magnetominusculus xianensis TaxID=1748249 RepID=A0ABR5SCG5_9BACT|nr:hypothetical protein [Candidatus Magnetominusculus xianensis]KWT81143.1 hypothetical protein ASN18_2649 [Candidatus Magnetominusculus xianensis]MBF0402973.1 hypothetical protein [Nitrospirota bacterium]
MDYIEESFIGSGDLYIDVLDAGGNRTGELSAGNARVFNINAAKVDKKDMKGMMRSNFGKTIKSIITKYEQSLKFTLTDFSIANLALAFMGAAATVAQSAGTVTNEAVTARAGKYVKLAKSEILTTPSDVVVSAVTPAPWSAATVYALGDYAKPTTPNAYRYECTTPGTSDSTEPVWPTTVGQTVTDGTAVWTCRKLTYTKTTDYEIDYVLGRIAAVQGGAITDGQSLEVDYSHGAATVNTIFLSTNQKIEVFIRLVGHDIANDRNINLELYKVSLSPSGDVEFVKEDYATLEFTGDILFTDAGAGKLEIRD